METIIREAGAGDLPQLDAALRAIARDLGDPYRGSVERLAAACTGPAAFASAALAAKGGAVTGAALFTALFSTTQGGPGVRVSDLWVSREERGTGLGRRLLAAAAGVGVRRWGAIFMMVPVYADNLTALRFYDRLGFSEAAKDRTMILARESFGLLLEPPSP